MVAVRPSGIAAAFVLVLLAPSPALSFADAYHGSSPPPPEYPPAEIDAGGHVAFTMGDRCTREASDVTACTRVGGLAGLHVASRYRAVPALALGVWGAFSVPGDDETWWQGAITVRVFPMPRRYPPLWVGAEGGLIAIAESLEADELGPAKTLTHTAPLFALGIGVNFPVLRFLTLGPELRGFVVPFGSQDLRPDRGSSYETQLGTVVGFTATVRVGGPE